MFNYFWMDKVAYTAAGGKGFSIFSLVHIIWLVLLFSGIFLLCVLYRKASDARRDNIRKCFALILIFSEIAKQCIVVLTGASASAHLPLHICSFAEYAILINAFWPKKRFLEPLLCLAFLPSAIMALFFPTITVYHPISYYTMHHFLLHAGIVAYILARCSAAEIRISYKGVWVTFFSIALLVIPIYFIDAAFDENFVFLMRHSDNPALKLIWDLSGGTGGISYIIGLGVLVIIVLHITYGIFTAIQTLNKRKSR